MIKTTEVFLWGTRIGLVHQAGHSSPASFEYDPAFLGSGIELSPFTMPSSSMVYTFPELARLDSFRGLPGLLADSLPDRFGNAIIEQWLNRQGRQPGSFSAVERLCYTGKRGMGALEYVPSTRGEPTASDIDVTEMTALASALLTSKGKATLDQKTAGLAQLIEIGSSAGGARAKAVIAWDEKKDLIKSGQTTLEQGFEHWLIKFDGVNNNGDHGIADQKQYSLIEYAYYLMAKDLDIDMMECRIFEKDGLYHFMTKRYDRINNQKIHVQTLGALKHYDYNQPGVCSYEIYADVARKLGLGKVAIQQIFRRMVFNVLGINCDDHVKNFSFTMNRDGKWNLAPAYDLTFAYNADSMWVSQHQMSINGKMRDITEEDLITSGHAMGLSKDFCRKVIENTRLTIGNWFDYASLAGISESRAKEINDAIVALAPGRL